MNSITYKIQDYVNISLIDADKSYYGIVSNIYAKNDQDVNDFIYLLKIQILKIYFINLNAKVTSYLR